LKILIIDDEINMIKTLGAVLKREGYDIRGVSNGEDALKMLASEPYDLIISDVKMPGMDGMTLLKEIRSRKMNTPVIIMTAYGTINDAVEAMKSGAADYVTKPFPMDEIKIKIKKLLELNQLRYKEQVLSRENKILREEIQKQYGSTDPISVDPAMKSIWKIVRKVADQKSTVLITGESGTGKEVVARTIHQWGQRINGAFIPVHCAALTPTLLESELFGHEKGSFTGAMKQKIGRFELADKGTLFLDEVGEIPPEIQVKLLRILQNHEFERVGGEKTIGVDVRVIAATNQDLSVMIQKGTFREDLFYRLNVITVHVPPLRDRPADILPLSRFFLEKLANETGKNFTDFTPDAEETLLKYAWPGNVRELENVIERAIVLESGPLISSNFLPVGIGTDAGKPGLQDGILAASEKDVILKTLEDCGGSRAETARRLGLGRTTLWRKLKEYGIE